MKFLKRLTAFILAIAVIVPALLFSADAETLDTAGPLYAGYAKIRIDPASHPDGPITGLPMPGYGASTDRLSTSGMDDTGDGKVDEKDGLFVTCIAITDQYEKTVIYYGIDVINPNSVWVAPAKKAVLAALEKAGYQLDTNDLYMSASHTHNGPDLRYGANFTQQQLDADPIAQRTKTYRDWVYEQLAQVSVEAMADREEVILTKGEFDVSDAIKAMDPNATANQQRMNYVRHYKTTVNGKVQYGGSNFGCTAYTAQTTMAMEPVDRMHLIQLTPKSGSKDPIVMVNWDAHVTLNSTTTTKYGRDNHTKMSSDWVNSLRYGMEAEGYRVAFSQGTGGNKTPQTPVKALKNPDIGIDGEGRGYLYGARLAEIALYGLENHMGKPLDTSRIRNMSASFRFDTNAPTPEEAELLTAMLAADPSTYPSGYPDLVDYLSHADTWGKRTEYYSTYPLLKKLSSRYQLTNARRRMQYLTTKHGSFTVGVLAIGTELSFVVAGNELADRYSFTDTLANTTDNDWDDLIDDTYGRPIVMGYTNSEGGYIPHQLAYIYNEGSPDYAVGSYESQSGAISRYTGEQLVAFYDDLLDSLNADEIRYQCACGGKAVGKEDHVCEKVEFMPWNRSDCLPTGGNYYLTRDIVTDYQVSISASTLRLDLNGHNITYRIPVEEGENAQAGTTHSTRVLTISDDTKLYLTDSTADPGTISRDLSLLTEAQKKKITNYGLLLYISGTSEATMFGGILDSTGAVAGGGGCVAVFNSASTFTMYGGLMKGGQSSDGGVLFNRGATYLYGGELTGGTTSGTTGYPGVYSLTERGYPIGRLTVGGNVRIWDNKRSNGAQINVYAAKPEESFTIKGNFTGKVGMAVSYPANGKLVGAVEDATLTANSLILDNSTAYRFAILGDQLVLTSALHGDIDGNGAVDTDDAVYLLLHAMFGDAYYPIAEIRNKDCDGNSTVDTDDAVYLLLHVMFGETYYPLFL